MDDLLKKRFFVSETKKKKKKVGHNTQKKSCDNHKINYKGFLTSQRPWNEQFIDIVNGREKLKTTDYGWRTLSLAKKKMFISVIHLFVQPIA